MNKVVIGVIAAIAVAAVGAAVGTAYFVKKSKRKLDVLDGVFDMMYLSNLSVKSL